MLKLLLFSVMLTLITGVANAAGYVPDGFTAQHKYHDPNKKGPVCDWAQRSRHGLFHYDMATGKISWIPLKESCADPCVINEHPEFGTATCDSPQ